MAKKVKVRGPVGHGGQVLVPDADGVIEVSDELAALLIESHGALAVPESEAAAKKPKLSTVK